jgi:hypothetical protein
VHFRRDGRNYRRIELAMEGRVVKTREIAATLCRDFANASVHSVRTRSAPVSTEASPSLSATTRPAMTVSASSDLVWLSGRGRLLTPHHWWRPRTCPIRLACGLAKECAPYRFGGRECRHRCKNRKYKDRISHVLLQASIIAKWFSFGVGRASRVGARRRPPQSDHSLAAIAP